MEGVETPEFLHLDVPATMTEPALQIRVSLDKESQKYTANSVTLAHPMVPINGKALRGARLQTRMSLALREALAESNPGLASPAVKSYFKGSNGRTIAKRLQQVPTDEVLHNAAQIYFLANAANEFPIRAVQRSLGIDYATATRFVRTLRRRDMIR